MISPIGGLAQKTRDRTDVPVPRQGTKNYPLYVEDSELEQRASVLPLQIGRLITGMLAACFSVYLVIEYLGRAVSQWSLGYQSEAVISTLGAIGSGIGLLLGVGLVHLAIRRLGFSEEPDTPGRQ